MATSTVEQYIKTLYTLQLDASGAVRTKDRADAMEVTPGTATAMAKHLDRQGLARYTARKGSVLSPKGEALALRVLRRHRLLETFLERVLDYDWSEVHAEAQRIDVLMGRPAFDPHGFPIPSAQGVVEARPFEELAACAAGRLIVVVKLSDETPQFLTLMRDNGLKPGEAFRVRENSSAAGVVTVRSEASGREFTMARELAVKIHVRPQGREPPGHSR